MYAYTPNLKEIPGDQSNFLTQASFFFSKKKNFAIKHTHTSLNEMATELALHLANFKLPSSRPKISVPATIDDLPYLSTPRYFGDIRTQHLALLVANYLEQVVRRNENYSDRPAQFVFVSAEEAQRAQYCPLIEMRAFKKVSEDDNVKSILCQYEKEPCENTEQESGLITPVSPHGDFADFSNNKAECAGNSSTHCGPQGIASCSQTSTVSTLAGMGTTHSQVHAQYYTTYGAQNSQTHVDRPVSPVSNMSSSDENRHFGFTNHNDDLGSHERPNSMPQRPLLQVATRFHSKQCPQISISNYLLRIIKYACIDKTALLMMLVYLDRLLHCKRATLTLNSLTVHRLVITAIVCAAKCNFDTFCTNAHYGKVGGISTREMNVLEMEFLAGLDYDLSLGGCENIQYYYDLVRRAVATTTSANELQHSN